MPRRSSKLWALIFLVLSAGIGGLALFGVVRLWGDHQPVAAADQEPDPPAPVSGTSSATPQPSPSVQRSADVAKDTSLPLSSPRPTGPPTSISATQKVEPSSSTPTPSTPVAVKQTTPQAPPPQPTTTAAPPTPAASIKKTPQYDVDLDLTKNRQQQVIDALPNDLSVTGLGGCDLPYELKDDSLVIKGARDIVIEFTVESLANGKKRVTLEPTVKTDAGKKLPFTLRNMETIKRQAVQVGEQATAALAALKAEQQTVDAFIKSKVRKTSAQDTASRARADQLKEMIPLAEQQLKIREAEFAVAAQMLELAQTLNENCHVLLDEAGAALKE